MTNNENKGPDVVGIEMKKILAGEVDPCVEISTDTGEDINLLFTGEVGCGKEIAADYAANQIRSCGHAYKNGMVRVNIAAIPSTLIAAELFGCAKGAGSYTAERDGVIKKCVDAKKVLFVDEVGAASQTEAMPILLRFLENREYTKMGEKKPEVQTAEGLPVIAATSEPEKLIDALRDRFAPVEIPPLRERIHDLPPLIAYFIERFDVNKIVQSVDMKIISDLTRKVLTSQKGGNARTVREVVRKLVYAHTSAFRKYKDGKWPEGAPDFFLTREGRLLLSESPLVEEKRSKKDIWITVVSPENGLEVTYVPFDGKKDGRACSEIKKIPPRDHFKKLEKAFALATCTISLDELKGYTFSEGASKIQEKCQVEIGRVMNECEKKLTSEPDDVQVALSLPWRSSDGMSAEKYFKFLYFDNLDKTGLSRNEQTKKAGVTRATILGALEYKNAVEEFRNSASS